MDREGAGQVALDKVFDLHFAGDYESLLRWLAFSVEVNFGPLLAGLRGRVAAVAPGASADAGK